MIHAVTSCVDTITLHLWSNVWLLKDKSIIINMETLRQQFFLVTGNDLLASFTALI